MITKNEIRFIKGLALKRNRVEHECFIVEGEKSISELLNSSFEIVNLYATSEWECNQELPIIHISNNELQRISTLKSPNKVLAVVKIPLNQIISNQSRITLVLDNINNPGNLGAIIRLCDWFSITNIICSFNTVDAYNPKVVQASMGSIFRVDIMYTNLPEYLKMINKPIYGAFLNGQDIKDIRLPEGAHLVIGSESNGISNEIRSLINQRVAIKNTGAMTESLNVATATAILLYQFC